MTFYRWLRAAVIAAVLFEVLYLADWALFKVRVSRGTAYGSVEVNQFLATSLKGSKTEYDMTGTTQEPCIHSIFSHAGNSPCWWLERHKSQWE